MNLPKSSRILCRDSNHASSKFKSYCVPSFEGSTFQIQFVFCAEIRTMHLPNSIRILCRDSNHGPSKFESYFMPRFEPCIFQIQVILRAEFRRKHLPNSIRILCRDSNHASSKSIRILCGDSNHGPSTFKSYFMPRFKPCVIQIQFVFRAEFRSMHLPNTSRIL